MLRTKEQAEFDPNGEYTEDRNLVQANSTILLPKDEEKRWSSEGPLVAYVSTLAWSCS